MFSVVWKGGRRMVLWVLRQCSCMWGSAFEYPVVDSLQVCIRMEGLLWESYTTSKGLFMSVLLFWVVGS